MILQEIGTGALDRQNSAALSDAFARHSSNVFQTALRVTRDRGVAEDVVQTVFHRLWAESATFDPVRGSLSSWLLMNARGRAVDEVRRNVARQKREVAYASSEVCHDDPSADVSGLQQRVRDALSGLPVRQRRAIELTFFGGLTYRAAAIEMGIPEGTAKSIIRTALSSLAVLLRAERPLS